MNARLRTWRGGSHRCAVSYSFLALCFCAGVVQLVAAKGISPERQRELVREGLEAFDQAVAVARQDAAQAGELYRKSAGAFEAAVNGGMQSAALQYNLGNAYYRQDELGKAILHYRRAESLAGNDRDVRANLEYARGQVTPVIAASDEDKLVRRLLAGHFDISAIVRFRTAAVLSIIGWTLLLLRLRWRLGGLMPAGVTCVIIGLLAAGSLAWQMRSDAATPPAVVVHGAPLLRLGRGEGYDPAMREPLRPGVELRVLEERADWVRVRLANDLTGWLPAGAIERV